MPKPVPLLKLSGKELYQGWTTSSQWGAALEPCIWKLHACCCLLPIPSSISQLQHRSGSNMDLADAQPWHSSPLGDGCIHALADKQESRKSGGSEGTAPSCLAPAWAQGKPPADMPWKPSGSHQTKAGLFQLTALKGYWPLT